MNKTLRYGVYGLFICAVAAACGALGGLAIGSAIGLVGTTSISASSGALAGVTMVLPSILGSFLLETRTGHADNPAMTFFVAPMLWALLTLGGAAALPISFLQLGAMVSAAGTAGMLALSASVSKGP